MRLPAKLQNSRPNTDVITSSAPVFVATDMTVGEYTKKYINSDLFIEAYLTIVDVPAGAPSVSFYLLVVPYFNFSMSNKNLYHI